MTCCLVGIRDDIAGVFFGGSGYELELSQSDRIALNDEPDMTRTFPIFRGIARTPAIARTPLPAADRSLSKAFDAILDALFFGLEPAVDRTVSHCLSQSRAMSCKQAYAGFDAPAYRRHGRLIPELEGSKL